MSVPSIYDLHGYSFDVCGSATGDTVLLSCYGPMGAHRLTGVLPIDSALELATNLINAAEAQRAAWASRSAA